MAVVGRAGSRRRVEGQRQSGLSLVEVLVAFTIFLLSVIGIMPIFMRSMMNNSGGNSYTQLSNNGRSQIEELFQLDFNDSRLAIPAGQTEVSVEQYWSETDHAWIDGAPPTGTAPWVRTTTVRQYNVDAVDKTVDNLDFDFSAALDGGLSGPFVHLKEIIVEVRSMGQGPLGPQRSLVLRTLKAK